MKDVKRQDNQVYSLWNGEMRFDLGRSYQGQSKVVWIGNAGYRTDYRDSRPDDGAALRSTPST